MNTNLLKAMIKSRTKVPMIMGKPGTGKSAIAKQIAEELGLQLIDVRLSQIDSVEVAGLPSVKGDHFEYVVPKWAQLANTKPSLIFFDELNRATQETMNAALQILLDKRMGLFEFNKDVYFIAAGNLGEEDGTNVNELENAILDRLGIIKYNLTLKDWVDSYGKKNVIPEILEFLDNHPSEFYKLNTSDNVCNYATPRSWSQLSDTIKDLNKDEKLEFIMELGDSYVGASIIPFIHFLKQKTRVSLKDVLNAKPEETKIFTSLELDKESQLRIEKELEAVNLNKITDEEFKNVSKFVKTLMGDLQIAYFNKIVLKIGEEGNYIKLFKDNEEMAKKYIG